MTPEREARRAKRREKTKAWEARVVEASEMARIERRLRSDNDQPSAHQLMRLLPWKAKGQSQRERFEFEARIRTQQMSASVSIPMSDVTFANLSAAFSCQQTHVLEDDLSGFDLQSLTATKHTWSAP